MKKYILLLIPLLFLMAQCHKTPTPTPDPEPDLPPATQEGKGTIGCYINGKPWVPKSYIAIGSPKYLEVVFDKFDNNYFGLTAIIDGSLNQSLKIEAYNTRLGMNIAQKIGPYQFLNFDFGNCATFIIDSTNTSNNYINITKLDTVKNIVSGTFGFRAINKCRDTVKITSGRFDTHF